MPNIPTYENKVPAPRANDMGSAAWAMAGRRIGIGYEQLGHGLEMAYDAYENHETMQEVSKLQNDSSDTIAKLSQSWSDTLSKADPNATDTAEKWRTDVLDPELEQLGADISTDRGQAARTELQARIRNEFTRLSIGGQSTLNQGAVQSNLENSAKTLSDTAYQHPEMMGFLVDTYHQGVESQLQTHPTLSAEGITNVRGQITDRGVQLIASSAARAMAERNPAAFQQAVKNGDFTKYLTGDQLSVLNNYASSQAREQDADARRAVEDNERQSRLVSEAQANKVLTSFVDPDSGAIKIPPNARASILADPLMRVETKKSLIGAVDAISKPQQFRDDPQVLNGLLQRTLLPPNNPDALTQAEVLGHVGKDISTSDYNFIMARMNGKTPADKTETRMINQTLAQAKAAIVSRDPMGGPLGMDHYSAFMAWFLPAYQSARKTHSWEQLLTQGSPDYMLGKNGAVLSKFGGSAQTGFDQMWQQLKAQSAKPQQQPAPKKPIADFMGMLLGGHK